MKTHLLLSVFLIIILLTSNDVADAQPSGFTCDMVTEIPKIECKVLITLYERMNGIKWTEQNNWLVTNTPCNWDGVKCKSGYISSLDLRGRGMNGHIPSELERLIHLEALDLGVNQLMGNIPPELGGLVNLRYLYLDYNQLNGNIPPHLGHLAKLEYLYLENNRISGNIPPELGNMSRLKNMSLDYNQLQGNIPPELSGLSDLLFLGLSNNELSGHIPPELGRLANLKSLRLTHNQLNGQIPVEIGNLTKLNDLYLSNNKLSGAMPSSLINLRDLKHISFYDTNLCEPTNMYFQDWIDNVDSLGSGLMCTSLLELPETGGNKNNLSLILIGFGLLFLLAGRYTQILFVLLLSRN